MSTTNNDKSQAGQALMSLVDIDTIWITANFKETQLKNMKPGQPVEIKVDATGRIKAFHEKREPHSADCNRCSPPALSHAKLLLAPALKLLELVLGSDGVS